MYAKYMHMRTYVCVVACVDEGCRMFALQLRDLFYSVAYLGSPNEFLAYLCSRLCQQQLYKIFRDLSFNFSMRNYKSPFAKNLAYADDTNSHRHSSCAQKLTHIKYINEML